MKTLTITDAKKNLGKWLGAAARGEEIGIVCGADIIALRKVEIQAADYAMREYGATPEDVERVQKNFARRAAAAEKSGKLPVFTPAQLRKMIG